MQTPQSNILRLPEVVKRTGLQPSTVYQHISLGKFPKQIKLGPRASGWLESEVDDWLQGRIEESRPEVA